ncbi:polysaccharide deacetylase family protein [Streptomyces sp. NPDC004009]
MALTFDDGPTRYTASLLRLLEAHDAVATFCLIGPHALQRPMTLRREQREQRDGDAIGDHTVTHPHLVALSPDGVRFELSGAARDIASVTGRRPTLLHPPVRPVPVTSCPSTTGTRARPWHSRASSRA